MNMQDMSRELEDAYSDFMKRMADDGLHYSLVNIEKDAFDIEILRHDGKIGVSYEMPKEHRNHYHYWLAGQIGMECGLSWGGEHNPTRFELRRG